MASTEDTLPSEVALPDAAISDAAAAPEGPPQPEPVASVEWAERGPDADPPTMAEACLALGVAPHLLRRLLEEFGDLLPPMAGGPEGPHLAREAVPILAMVIRLRNEGVPGEEIRRLVAVQRQMAEDVAAAAVQDAPAASRLVSEVAQLRDELRRSEERRSEDRDRLLMALMRTSQELQRLRQDLSAHPSRKQRRGWLSRLFR